MGNKDNKRKKKSNVVIRRINKNNALKKSINRSYKQKATEEAQKLECAEITQAVKVPHDDKVEVPLDAELQVPCDANLEVPYDATFEAPQAAEVPQASTAETIQASEQLRSVMTEVPQIADGPAVTLCNPTQNENFNLTTASNSLLIEIQPFSSSEQRTKELRNQLKTCVVPTCLKDQFSHPDLTFFSLPNDTRYRKYWCNRIDRKDLWLLPLTQVSKLHVCNLHFEERYLFNFDSKLVLLSKAVPTLNVPVKNKPTRPYQKRQKRDKGVECAVSTCKNNTTSELKFFLVPQNKRKAEVWYHNMGLKLKAYRAKSYDTHMICEIHFEKREIKYDSEGNHLLFGNAVPTLNLPVPREKLKHYKSSDATRCAKRTLGTQTYDVYFTLPTNDAPLQTEFVDLYNQQPLYDTTSNEKPAYQHIEPKKVFYYEPPAKIQKRLLSKEPPQEENIGFKVEHDDNDENFTVVISTNPLDPKIVDSLHDSIAEARIKDEPVDLISGVDDSCENTVARTNDSITLSNSFIKNKIKLLFENGKEDTQLLFNFCDQYCSKRTKGALQLKKEILS